MSWIVCSIKSRTVISKEKKKHCASYIFAENKVVKFNHIKKW